MKRKNQKAVRKITYIAFLIALEVVLNRFCSINTAGLKIGFSFVPVVVAASLFGPLSAALVYAMSDFIGAVLFPIGVYHPGFTLCAALMGALYGLFLYKKPEREGGLGFSWKKISLFPNVVVPALVNNLVFGLAVNTYWVSMLYGNKSYAGWFVYRLGEYVVMIPVIILLTPAILRLCNELRRYTDGKDA